MRPKVLLVDDDKDLLEMYREILAQLPSHPEIFTASSGPKAIAMMEAEPFTLLVTDLNMPKMDGLQVLSIVRRRFPELRTVVLTSVLDEQFRSRVYALGVDLFWQKPASGEEIKQFLDCLESLIGREIQGQGGFRGVQSKSLVDIIQLECLAQTSIVLKITNGPLTGRIWVGGGEVIDAETDGLAGVDAFRRILTWKAGSFETQAADSSRTRTIFNSYQGLLLETVQAQDEANNKKDEVKEADSSEPHTPLTPLVKFPGVEFVLALRSDQESGFESRGLENAQPVADWTRQAMDRFRMLGETVQAGPLLQVEAIGPQIKLGLASRDEVDFCVGWKYDLTPSHIHETMKKVLALWAS